MCSRILPSVCFSVLPNCTVRFRQGCFNLAFRCIYLAFRSVAVREACFEPALYSQRIFQTILPRWCLLPGCGIRTVSIVYLAVSAHLAPQAYLLQSTRTEQSAFLSYTRQAKMRSMKRCVNHASSLSIAKPASPDITVAW